MSFNTEHFLEDLSSQGYYLCDEFLNYEHFQALRAIAVAFYQEGRFRKAKIGLKSAAGIDQKIRGDEIYWTDEDQSLYELEPFMQKINDLAQLLNHTFFMGLYEFESHFASYPPGGFYKKHIDQFAQQKTRKISCIYYLNDTWEPSYGGNLQLYTLQDQPLKEILPCGNRFICFTSDLPHEVKQTSHLRYSIAGWFKTQTWPLR